MAGNDTFTNQLVSDKNLQRMLKRVTAFGQTFDEALDGVLTKIELMDATAESMQAASARLVASAAEMDASAATGYIGAPHGPAGLFAVSTAKPQDNQVSPYHYRVGRNVMLPIGMNLRAQFRGLEFEAVVTPAGIGAVGEFFETPTAAAVAVKVKLGIDRRAAQTNGWLFWSYEESGDWYPLARLRQHQTGERGDEE